MQLIWGEYRFQDHDVAFTNSIVEQAISKLVRRTIASAVIEEQVTRPENKGVCIITQYYRPKSKQRQEELVYCINKNLEVADSAIIFTEDLSRKQLRRDGIKLNNKTETVKLGRLNYRAAFKYVKIHGNDDTVYLLTNTDCYFESVDVLLSIDYSKLRFLTMSRWEYIEGSLDIARNPRVENWDETQYLDPPPLLKSDPPIEPWSSDSWAFKRNLTQNIDIGRFYSFLGISLCEILTTHEMIKEGVHVHNIGFCGHIKPIHVHKAASRKPEDWAESKNLSDHIPGIFPKGKRDLSKSINNCWRQRHPDNFLDSDNVEHDYSDFVVRNLKDL